MAGIHDGGSADDAGYETRGRWTSSPLSSPLPRHRKRKLGLRWQHDARLLPQPTQDLQPFRAQLQSGAAGQKADAEDCGRPRGWRAPLDGVDGSDHEGLPASHVELGYERPIDALLHRGEVAAIVYVRGFRRDRVRANPEVYAGHE